MNPELTEILIGKFIDSEITPAEQRLLDAELASNPESQQLLAALQELHERTRQALNQEIVDTGAAADTILERAWQKRGSDWPRRITRARWCRVAATLAAGFVLGAAVLHLAMQSLGHGDSPISADQEQTPSAVGNPLPSDEHAQVASRMKDDNGEEQASPWVLRPVRPRGFGRELDWYSYTDPNGTKWLIEGYRDNAVRRANFEGD